MPTEIVATYRVVTPMFCAGATPSHAEVRAPSFKGVLRFWWRALAWSRLRGDLKAIKKEEDKLFGSAGGGRSKVSMRVNMDGRQRTIRENTVLTVSEEKSSVVGEGARYLGYGVMEAFPSKTKNTKAGQLTRSCVRAPFDFTIQMRGRNLTEAESSSLENALVALGTFGGVGAKSRKGYGSLVLKSLLVGGRKPYRPPQDMTGLHDAIKKLQPNSGGQTAQAALLEFTALSTKTRYVLLSSDKKEPMELLDLVGRELMRYRSWGHNGNVLGQPSERNFKDDHDLMKQPAGERKTHPRRIAFGLPHNYGKRPDLQVDPYDKEADRRASPLFVHVHECGDTPVAVLSFLPARFLRKDASDVSVGRTRIAQRPEDELYSPIHDFLDRLLDENKRKEPFTEVQKVQP